MNVFLDNSRVQTSLMKENLDILDIKMLLKGENKPGKSYISLTKKLNHAIF